MNTVLLWEGAYKGKPTRVLVEDHSSHSTIIIEQSSSGVVKDIMEGVLSFAKAHPFLTGWMTGMAWDAIKKYNEAKKNVIYFNAKDASERTKYEGMIKELRKVGYTVVKSGYINGTGYRWELNRP